jgi:hypothetical protein
VTNRLIEAEIVNKYLCQIKKKLPLSIRLDREDLNAILAEIEEHIWEKAVENATNGEPSEIDLQIAISQMGNATEIAENYSIKSTPYVFISEELYPYYNKSIKLIILSFFLTLLFPLGIFFLFSLGGILYIIMIYLTIFLIVKTLFYYLSTKGYSPYEVRISKFQKKFSKSMEMNYKSIKDPINFKNSIIWAIIWLIGASFFTFLSFLTKNPDYYNITLFIGLFITSMLRMLFGKRSPIWQRIFILIQLIQLYFLIASHAVIDITMQDGYSNLGPINDMFNFLHLWLFPIYLIAINYKILQFFTIDYKFENYFTYLSLQKRILTEKSYIHRSQNYQKAISDSNSNEIDKEFDLIRNSEFYKQEIKKLIKKSYNKLPIWFSKSEKKNILNEIENQIKEVILENYQNNHLSAEKLNDIFQKVADFDNLLLEFKLKGTPKLYISKELWPQYMTTIKAFVTYFILLGLFTIILQISYRAVFSLYAIFSIYVTIYWLIMALIFTLITSVFTYLSSNNFIPKTLEHAGTGKTKMTQNHLFFIFDRFFAIIYLTIGCILLMYTIYSGYFIINLQELPSALFSVFCVLTLGLIKISKSPVDKIEKKHRLVNTVIILGLSFLIFFILMVNFHLDRRFIHSGTFIDIYNLLFFPINIEIIYNVFQFFFVKRSKI